MEIILQNWLKQIPMKHFLNLLMTNVSMIVDQTNIYAQQIQVQAGITRGPTSTKEIKKFLGLDVYKRQALNASHLAI